MLLQQLNASDCRNGTVVKQYFGDALGSHRFKRFVNLCCVCLLRTHVRDI